MPSPALNAAGTVSRAGGARLSAGVRAAIDHAGDACFDMAALHVAAGQDIAAQLGVPAALVTTGAAAALALGAAAAIARDRVAVMNRLPLSDGLRREFLVARSHRNAYDRALLLAGARLVEIGIPDRISSAGVRDAETGDFADAIGAATAGILWLAQPGQEPPLPALAALCRAHDLVLLVDAAAQLPPASLPRELLAAGADLVAVSGGKALSGPAGTGLLLGRADLVRSALLQCLDLDFLDGTFIAPALLGPVDRLPVHGIGRAMKVGKEAIAGLRAAVAEFVAADPAARAARQRAVLAALRAALGTPNGLQVTAHDDPPRLEVAVDAAACGRDARGLARALAAATPAVLVGHGALRRGALLLRADCLSEAEAAQVGLAIRAAVG